MLERAGTDQGQGMRAKEFVFETTVSGDMAVISQPLGVLSRFDNSIRSNKYGVRHQSSNPKEKHVSRRFKNSFGH